MIAATAFRRAHRLQTQALCELVSGTTGLTKMQRLAFASLPLPFLVLTVSVGDFALYRVAQAASLCLLVASVFWRRHPIWPSWQALCLCLTLITTSTHAALLYGSDVGALILAKTVIFSGFILATDQARRHGFNRVAQCTVPLALITVLAIGIAIVIAGESERASYVGLHPNLGGEILFGCIVLLCFAKPVLWRLVGYGVAIAAMLALQSRAALLGSGLVIIGAEVLALRPITLTRTHVHILTSAAAILTIGATLTLLAFPHLVEAITRQITDGILLLRHADRGLGTGLVGRVETWNLALQTFLDHPFFGVGMDQVRTPEGLAIHNAYLGLLAEFGLVAALPLLVIIAGLWQTAHRDVKRFFVLFAGAFVLFFNARTLNLNLFPLIIWIACLPWASDGKMKHRQTQRA
ncbi:MAG: O-antigen ligase family protein [Pseudomonadota bacterium]